MDQKISQQSSQDEFVRRQHSNGCLIQQPFILPLWWAQQPNSLCLVGLISFQPVGDWVSVKGEMGFAPEGLNPCSFGTHTHILLHCLSLASSLLDCIQPSRGAESLRAKVHSASWGKHKNHWWTRELERWTSQNRLITKVGSFGVHYGMQYIRSQLY